MNNQSIQPQCNGDEIDLRELWATLVRRKLTIITMTIIGTLIAVGYVMTVIPTFQGSALVEVGEVVNSNQVVNNNQLVNNQPTTIFNLDNINTLKEVTSVATGTNITIPNGTNNILLISVESTDKTEVRTKLNDTVQFILNRHQEKAKLYEMPNAKIRMTQLLGDISISDQPIKPRKELIIVVGFIAGLILGIFVAFFKEFISNNRKNEEG